MTPDEFRKKLSEWKAETEEHIPDFVLDYIEELEKKLGKKKTVYTVRAIYQHDFDVEHRVEYQGSNAEAAFKQCYECIAYDINDTVKNYGNPFDENDEKEYTGLQVKQMFIDKLHEAIDKKESFYFNFQFNSDWMPYSDGEAGGFELDITEV